MATPPGLTASPSLTPPGRSDVIAGRYRVERKLGSGGMGLVVAAVDLQTNERVAIKLLRSEGPMPSGSFDRADESGVIERSNRHLEMSTRLIREASNAARLSSEHVTRVLDVGRLESGDPYVVMEYLDGVDLGRYAKDRGPLPVVETVNLVLQACEAIFEAHERGIVHRDLKPANLFLTSRADGSPLVKVLDFGISKVLGADDNQLTATSDILGSPLYMSPEQIRDARDVDARSDVWSIGGILYRLLAGRPAFEAQGSAGTLAAIISDAPYPLRALRPDVPPDLEMIVLRCLEKDRARRIQSVRELAIALQRFAHGQTGALLPAPVIHAQSGATPMGVLTPPSGVMGAMTPASGVMPLPPPPAVPSSFSEGPSSITVSGGSGRSSALFALVGVLVGALVAGGIAAWQLTSGPSAAGSAAPSAGPSIAPIASGAPSVATIATAEPSATATTTSAPSASTTSAPSSTASVKPAPHPIGHGRPSDDPLGDRL
ncbi:MAG: serine/threonine-protein kinase [Polyangiaceae bacterium]